MRNKIILTAILLFFLGFPLAGVMFFWKDMQRKVQGSAHQFVDDVGTQVLQTWDHELLLDEGTTTLKAGLPPETFAKWKAEFGTFESLGQAEAKETWAKPKNDMMWQYTRFEVPVEFSTGPATLFTTVTRKTVGPRWRFETFELKRTR